MTKTHTHSPAAIEEIEGHAFSDVTREVGGILVGTFEEGAAHIAAALPALQAVGSQTNVTFTHEVWDHVLDVIERDHTGQRIVGWYHTHPGFGLFLSEYDQFIHQNFFSDPRMLALVVDPKAGELGWFVWRDGKIVLDSQAPTSTPALGTATARGVSSPQRTLRRYAVAFPALLLASGIGGYLLGQQDAPVSSASPEASTRVNDIKSQLDAARGEAADARQTVQVLRRQLQRAKPGAESMANGSGQPTIGYRVRPGDTLWDIAASLYGDGTAYRRLLSANPGASATGLQVGQVVRVPIRDTSQDEGR